MPSPTWAPDSALVGVVRPSPNHNARQGDGKPDALVLHYTGMADGPSAIARLCDAEAEVSSHYVVREDGTIVQLVAEARRAWHAGREVWGGEADLNSASIGIEIVNGGHDFGLPPYPAAQMGAVVALCRDIVSRHAIARHRVLGHSDIAPRRKQDPGEHFPWDVLAAAGIGLWVPPSNDRSDAYPDPATLLTTQSGLARYGYRIDPTGVDDEASRIVVRAFQRHFRPAHVDGLADVGTRDTLGRLVAALDVAALSADRAGVPTPP